MNFAASPISPLAIGLVTPAFFAAGAALAAIPLVIHFLNRRRYRIVDWAAMTFLLAAMKKNRRRLKFEQWILLATRCLIIGFLGIALARPLGCDQAANAFSGRRSGLHIVIVDNSFPMTYRVGGTNGGTHLDQAKRVAKKLVDSLASGGESVVLITAAKPAKAIIATASYDLSAVSEAIGRIAPTHTAADYAGALALAKQAADEAKASPSRTVTLLTNSTQGGWDASPAANVEQLGKDLAGVAKLRVFNLTRPGEWNHAVVDLRTGNDRLLRAGFPTEFAAAVKGFGPIYDTSLAWSLDNQPLPGGGAIKPEVETREQTQSGAHLNEGGTHVIAASLKSSDALSDDNVRYRVADVTTDLKVLVVEGRRDAGEMQSSGSFLALALAPPAEAGSTTAPSSSTAAKGKSASYVEPELVTDGELSSRTLGDYRAIILCDVGVITTKQAADLKVFVEAGGTLMMFMGEQVSPKSYNDSLLPAGLLPGAIVKRNTAGGEQPPFHFDFKPYGNLHPYLDIFRNQENVGIDTAQVFSYLQVDLPADTKAERVLNFLPEAGTSAPTTVPAAKVDPAITMHDVGRGRVVFCATSADDEWTSLTHKPAYVALIHELIAGSTAGGDRWMNLLSGDAFILPTSMKLTATPKLFDSRRNEVSLERQGDGYRTPPIDAPGMYSLETGAAKFPIAVNVPAAASDVRPVNDAAIRKRLGEVEIDFAGADVADIAAANSAGNDFGWPFMACVLLLVGAECVMAQRFGQSRR